MEKVGGICLRKSHELPSMPSTQFLRRLQGVTRALERTEPFAVTRHGKPEVVVLDVEDYERLVSLIENYRQILADLS